MAGEENGALVRRHLECFHPLRENGASSVRHEWLGPGLAALVLSFIRGHG